MKRPKKTRVTKTSLTERVRQLEVENAAQRATIHQNETQTRDNNAIITSQRSSIVSLQGTVADLHSRHSELQGYTRCLVETDEIARGVKEAPFNPPAPPTPAREIRRSPFPGFGATHSYDFTDTRLGHRERERPKDWWEH